MLSGLCFVIRFERLLSDRLIILDFVHFSKQFGDISREIESRRKAWVKDYLGDEAAANYQFGDITRKALGKFTGKGDDYQFGDATKKLLGDLFGKKK